MQVNAYIRAQRVPANCGTRVSLRRVLRTLKPLRTATVQINGTAITLTPDLSPDQEELINALASPTPRH